MESILFIIAMSGLIWFAHKMVTNYPEMPTPLGFYAEAAERELREGMSPLVPLRSETKLTSKEEKEWQSIVSDFDKF
jgi:hypothetical protein